MDRDQPVTDVQFLCDVKNCPKGYTVISRCPCGHEAQLWEKVLGGKDGERYLCYTKEDQNGYVIDHMYIPKRFDQYLKKGYSIIEKTVEGKDPMRHRQLAVRRVRREEATQVVADVIVCRGGDTPSKLYKKLEKINGVCICYRLAEYKGGPAKSERRNSDPATSLSKPSGRGDDRARSHTLAPKHLSQQLGDLRLSQNAGSNSAPSAPPLSPERTFPPTPPPEFADGHHEEAAVVRVSSELGSAPPLPPSSGPAHQTTSPSYPAPPSTSAYPSQHVPPSSSPSYPPTPSYPPASAAPPPSSYQYPPPSGPPSYAQPSPYRTPAPGYPPYQPGGYYSRQPQAYSQPTVGYPPPQPGYGVGTGYSMGPPGAAMGGAPMGYPGYSSVAGSSFAGFTGAPKPSGPAPYNPFQQGTAPPYPPPPTAGPAPYPPQPHPSGYRNYGFNI